MFGDSLGFKDSYLILYLELFHSKSMIEEKTVRVELGES